MYIQFSLFSLVVATTRPLTLKASLRAKEYWNNLETKGECWFELRLSYHIYRLGSAVCEVIHLVLVNLFILGVALLVVTLRLDSVCSLKHYKLHLNIPLFADPCCGRIEPVLLCSSHKGSPGDNGSSGP
jgi:hypothetical protein